MKLVSNILRTREFLAFCREFFSIASQVRSVLVALILLIGIGGWILSNVESIPFWDGQYLAFVTALTIGYGDLSPTGDFGKVLCIVLGVIGMVWIGLVVGVASVALRRSVEEGHDGENA